MTTPRPQPLDAAPELHRRALALALRAADLARELVRAAERGESSSGASALGARLKLDGSVVTAVDLEVEARVRALIGAQFPDHAILGEELSDHESEAEAEPPSAYEWVIDPIDGTAGFVHGVPLAATLICLRERGVPVVAVADFPSIGRRLHAVRGCGTHEDGRPVRVCPSFDPKQDIVCHGDPYTFALSGHSEWIERAQGQLKFFRSYTDAFGHYLVARGSAALVLDAAMERWDLAATRLLVEEAGGIVARFPDRNDPRRSTVISGCEAGVQWMRDLLGAA
ncbi:Histidinol-phosphatase [Enhygromyxa salina]|uniref:Histidinol-phosphatase n=1 Tax=Enhygromyxa salina TaxID=215803 RepID=A0A2S9XBU8_9BACT|nr:inositol monophosphatase family protein [Enhygromyxa salina]PRP90332.1 Histidinol-phosphatase [Enhygromyxa salina]